MPNTKAKSLADDIKRLQLLTNDYIKTHCDPDNAAAFLPIEKRKIQIRACAELAMSIHRRLCPLIGQVRANDLRDAYFQRLHKIEERADAETQLDPSTSDKRKRSRVETLRYQLEISDLDLILKAMLEACGGDDAAGKPTAPDKAEEWSRSYTIQELTKIFGISRNTMSKRLREGKAIRCKRLGGLWSIARTDLPPHE